MKLIIDTEIGSVVEVHVLLVAAHNDHGPSKFEVFGVFYNIETAEQIGKYLSKEWAHISIISKCLNIDEPIVPKTLIEERIKKLKESKESK